MMVRVLRELPCSVLSTDAFMTLALLWCSARLKELPLAYKTLLCAHDAGLHFGANLLHHDTSLGHGS